MEVLYRAVRGSRPGIYNVAADGVLLLSQALRVLGRPAIPMALPLAGAVGSLLRRLGLVDFSADQLRMLVYGRAADTSRLREEFGFRPTRTAREALLDFAEVARVRPMVSAERVAGWERGLAWFPRRTRQERFERERAPGG